MPDSLKRLTESLDRERATRRRLTGEPVLPDRREASKRRVCRLCWRQDESKASLCTACGGEIVEVVL